MEIDTIKINVGMSWEIVKLGDVVKMVTGKTPPTKNIEYFDGEYLWVNPSDFGSKFIIKSKRTISQKAVKEKKSILLPMGTILLSCIGDIGKIGILKTEGSSNQQITALITNDKVYPDYLYYYLMFSKSKLESLANKAVVAILNNERLRGFDILLPPLATQKRIAEILDAADALKRKDQQLLKKYDELAQAIFIDMFGDPVKNEKGWEEDILKNVTIKIGSGSTPTGGKTAYKESGISLIRSMNVYDFSFKWKDLAFIDENQAKKLNNVTVQTRDVLFNITGASVCRCSIVPDELLPARVNQHVAIIRTNETVLNPIFLNHLLVSEKVKNKLLGVGSGGGAVMEAITKEQLESYKIIIPPIEIQNKFEFIINLVFGKKKIHNSTEEKAKSLFNTLIQKAFNGELVN